MVWHEQNIEWLFRILVAAGTFLGITAILQLYFEVSIFVPDYTALIHHHETRAVGTFTNASEYGLVLSVFILIGGLLYTRTQDAVPRLVLLGCLALMVVGLVLSQTRAPWLGAVVSLAFVCLYDKKVQSLMITLAVFTTASVAIALPFLVDFASLSLRLMDVQPIFNRLAVWVASLNMMIQNPLFGIGFGTDTFTESLHEYALK